MKPILSQKGFTLIEVLMATAILSVSLLALASMTVTVIKGNERANKVTIATTLAQEKIEEIRQLSYATVNYADEPYGSFVKYGWARRETIVIPDTPQTDVKKVKVVVSMKDTKGGEKTLVDFTVLKSR